jgi:hypothetical protein
MDRKTKAFKLLEFFEGIDLNQIGCINPDRCWGNCSGCIIQDKIYDILRGKNET